MKDNRDLEQVLRIDGKSVFMEVMLSGLPYDKVLLNFVSYDATAAAGARASGSVGIFIDILDAQVLAHDILGGRISALGQKSKKHAQETGAKYPDPVYESLGGIPGKRCPDGVPVARVFQISPGTTQPWVFCAKQGKGHETDKGLIVLDKLEHAVRVPMTNAMLKKFAFSLQAVYDVWVMTRFTSVIKPVMQQALARRQQTIDAAKAASASRSGAQYGTR